MKLFRRRIKIEVVPCEHSRTNISVSNVMGLRDAATRCIQCGSLVGVMALRKMGVRYEN